MQELKNIVVVDGDEISSFISQGVFKDLKLPYNITYLSSTLQGLGYLKQNYPKEASEEAGSHDLLLLGMSLKCFEFLDELENCQRIASSRLWIVMLSPMLTNRETKKISEYKNIKGCFPKLISKEVINEVLEIYLASIHSPLKKREKENLVSRAPAPAGLHSRAAKDGFSSADKRSA